nr:MAG TPA: hypothetical protein [Caudoviricetes sp.]DAM38441.1 MAG TPA: hypothetical protein [Caudoviricetes sp.]
MLIRSSSRTMHIPPAVFLSVALVFKKINSLSNQQQHALLSSLITIRVDQ